MKLFTWAEIFCVGWAAFNENCPNMDGVAECETNCETNFIECQVACGGDVECVSACNRIFATCEASCPCHDNCFEGCPCDPLSQYCWYYPPIRFWLINPKVSSVTNFRQFDYIWSPYGEELNSIQWFSKIENESRNMCNFVYRGENYLVGGGYEGSTKNKPNQQYKVTKYGYTKMADLPFDFTAGRCQGLSQSAVLCSPEQADNKCWELTGSNYEPIADTNVGHYLGGLGVVNDQLFIFGGKAGEDFVFEGLKEGNWYQRMATLGRKYNSFSTVSIDENIYLYGGNLDGKLTKFAFIITVDSSDSMDSVSFNKLPTELQEARQNHESIAVGSTVVHIGGTGVRHTERWDIDPNGEIKVTISNAPPFNSWESKPYTFPAPSS